MIALDVLPFPHHWPDEFSFRVVNNKLTEKWADREAEAAPVNDHMGYLVLGVIGASWAVSSPRLS